MQRGGLGIFIVFIVNITVNNEYLDLSIIALPLNHGNLQQLFCNNSSFIRINNKTTVIKIPFLKLKQDVPCEKLTTRL